MIHSIWFNSSSSHHVLCLVWNFYGTVLNYKSWVRMKPVPFPVNFKLKWNLYNFIKFLLYLWTFIIFHWRRQGTSVSICSIEIRLSRVSDDLVRLLIRIIFCLNLDICMKILLWNDRIWIFVFRFIQQLLWNINLNAARYVPQVR